MVRKCIDHSIEFETTPESVAGIGRGLRGWCGTFATVHFINGHVTQTGVVVASRESVLGCGSIAATRVPLNANTNSYVREATCDSTRQLALLMTQFEDAFSAVTDTSTDRVYEVDGLSIGEEGFVKVTGAHMPLADNGALEIMQGWDDDEGFVLNDNEF